MSTPAEDVPKGAADPSTKDILLWAGKISYWIAWPVYYLFYYLLYYLSLFLLAAIKLVVEPLSYILAPLFYLGRFVFACIQAPFRFLARFETLYIYLAIGALIGLSGGLILSLIYTSLQKPLGLDSKPPAAVRTAKEYREEKRTQKAKSEHQLSTTVLDVPSDYFSLSESLRKGAKRKGLATQTIMEEADSDY